MKQYLHLLTSIICAVLFTLILAVVSVLALMFSTGEGEIVDKRAIFGAVFFRTRERPGDVLGVDMGVANMVPLLVIFLVTAVLVLAIQNAYRVLKARKAQLIAEKKDSIRN